MTALSKHDLEQMLQLLDLSILDSIDTKHHQDTYTSGSQPLLHYTPEALREYATTVYQYILPHIEGVDITLEDYIARWLAPYKVIQAQLASKADDFINRLTDIASNPILLPAFYYIIPEQCLYTQISNFLNKKDNSYNDLNDFLTSTASPLRHDYMSQYGFNFSDCPEDKKDSIPTRIEDSRMTSIIAEVDAMRATANKALAAFIGSRSDYTWQTDTLISSKGRKKTIRYKVPTPASKPTYGTELERLRQPILDQLAYYNLNPADISSITAHKEHLPQDKVTIVEQALASESLNSKARTAITDLKKLIKEADNFNFKLPKLKAISKTKYLLSDSDYKTINILLHSSVDWTSSADDIIAQYDANIKTCIASAEYQAMCAKVQLAQHLIDHYCDPAQPECKALSPFVELSKHKDPESAKQLLQSQQELHAVTSAIHELFIRSFASNVASAYSKLEPISIFALTDAEKDYFVDCNPEETERIRQALINLLAREGYNTDWFPDYTNITKPLSSCLNITLNDLTVCPNALAHGAVMGMIEWSQQVKAQLIAITEGDDLVCDYKALAQDLRDKLQHHTLACNSADYLMVTEAGVTRVKGKSAKYIQDRTASLAKPSDLLVHNGIYGIVKVCEPAPLPDIVPTDAEPQLPTAQYINKDFTKAEEYWTKIEVLQPDTAFALFTEVSSVEIDQQALVPVHDRTIQRLLPLFAGVHCTAYMLDDSLYAHTVHGEYLKILPNYALDKYATYEFSAVNWKTLNSLINRYVSLLKDTEYYDDIINTVNERQNFNPFDTCGTSRQERLHNRYRRYCKDTKFFYELKKLCEDYYKDTDKEALVYSLPKTFVKPCYISQSYLSTWVHQPEDYAKKLGQTKVDAQGEIIEYQIHHNDKNPSNNNPDNLAIHDKDTHDDLKSNCIPVLYRDHLYPSISDYCEKTDAGAINKVQQTLKQLKPGATEHWKNRDYHINPDSGVYTATDSIPQVTFNGIPYSTPKAFATAKKLGPDALRKKIKSERNKGSEVFCYKGFRFELLEDDSIKITK